MEVVIQVPPPIDFNFDSACSSPYMTAPSSPQRLNNNNNFFFFSTPASPSRASSFFKELNDISLVSTANHFSTSSSTIPFNWEEKEKHGTPKAKANNKEAEDIREEFEFEFSGQLERTSLSAEELFDQGKIRPLKPPSGFDFSSQSSSPRSPSSRTLNKQQNLDPFQAALEVRGKREIQVLVRQERGRERAGSARDQKRSSRSLSPSPSPSPIRLSDIIFKPEEINSTNPPHKIITATSSSKQSYIASMFSSLSFSSKSNKKWKLKNLLLFRSASEGRPSSSDANIRIGSTGNRDNSSGKYTVLPKKEVVIEDVKNSSFRSIDGSVGGNSRRRPSFAEVHYTANRAVSEEMKRKTPLPYKQGLLGCLMFNNFDPGVHHLSRGIGSLTRGR